MHHFLILDFSDTSFHLTPVCADLLLYSSPLSFRLTRVVVSFNSNFNSVNSGIDFDLQFKMKMHSRCKKLHIFSSLTNPKEITALSAIIDLFHWTSWIDWIEINDPKPASDPKLLPNEGPILSSTFSFHQDRQVTIVGSIQSKVTSAEL